MAMQKTPLLYTAKHNGIQSRLKEVPGKPKDIVSLLFKEAGSVLEANSVSELPRDSRQVYSLLVNVLVVLILCLIGSAMQN